MEENQQNKMLKNKILTGIICGVIIIIVSVSLCFMYNYIVRKNNVVELTSSNLTENISDEQIDVENNTENIDPIQEYDELTDEELKQLEEQKKLEEQKQLEEEEKIQEEKKKAEEAKKKQETEEQKKNQIAQTSNYKYYLKVNYTANTVTAYTKDQNGNYTVPVRAMICSTGRATPTSGVYRTMNKYRWRLLIGNSYGQYSTRITGQILFHSVPYERQSEDSLITAYYDRLGITTSMGCIRLTVADAKWIYDNCPLGTCVEFYSSSNPGPLGKPSAKKITSYGAPLNRWDPTDPNVNNPWRTYNVNNNTNSNTDKNNTVNSTTNNNTNKNNTVNNTTNSNTNKNNTVNNTTNNNTNKNNTVNNTTNSNTNKNNTVNNTTNNNTNKNNAVNNTTNNNANKNNTVNNTTNNNTNKNNTVNNTTNNNTNKNNTVNNTTNSNTNKNNTVNNNVNNTNTNKAQNNNTNKN